MIGDRARISVKVEVPPSRAFEIFTDEIDRTVTHQGLSALRPDNPARHGLQGSEFSRMIGLWWGEQLSSLRLVCGERES